MSRRRLRGRKVNGILVLNKHEGPTSNGILQSVKRFYSAAKAGHTGSLDPIATGVLPICFGEATKFSQYLLDSDKAYRVRAVLGTATETGDREGKVISSNNNIPSLHFSEFQQLVKSYRGLQKQIPSMFSAIKYKGKPLYEYARQGIEVPREPREINIYEIDLEQFEGREFSLRVQCSKGTYIRSLVEDIGSSIGCGAHVVELERTQCGPYSLDESYSFDQLQEMASDDILNVAGGSPEVVLKEASTNIKSIDYQVLDDLLLEASSAVSHWPMLSLGDNTAYYLMKGQAVQVPNAPPTGWVRLGHEARFLGVGQIMEDGKVAPRKLIDSQSFKHTA